MPELFYNINLAFLQLFNSLDVYTGKTVQSVAYKKAEKIYMRENEQNEENTKIFFCKKNFYLHDKTVQLVYEIYTDI